ncbi:MAG: hypothetical protein WBE14_00815 [Xanthobacteraceae bacterium]
MNDGSVKNQANAQFAKTQRLDDAKQALAEYEAAALATRAKTERLRALRLAREAASPPQATKRKSAPAKKGKTGGKSAGNSSGRLADWLDGEAKEGRRG